MLTAAAAAGGGGGATVAAVAAEGERTVGAHVLYLWHCSSSSSGSNYCSVLAAPMVTMSVHALGMAPLQW